MSKIVRRPHSGADQAPWFKHRWPWLLMLGPFLVVIASSVSAWLAVTRPDALVEGDYYVRGKAINQDLRRDRAAGALGLGAALGYDAASGRLEGRIVSRKASVPAVVILHLAHATLPEKDVRVILRPDADGRFSVALPMLERTRWQVLMEDEGRGWRLEGSWSWPSQREVQILSEAPADN